MPTTIMAGFTAALLIASRAMLAKFGYGLNVGKTTMLCASSQMMTSKRVAKSGFSFTHTPNCA